MRYLLVVAAIAAASMFYQAVDGIGANVQPVTVNWNSITKKFG